MSKFLAYFLSFIACVIFTTNQNFYFESSTRLWIALKGFNTGIDIFLSYKGKISFLHFFILTYAVHFCKSYLISLVLHGTYLSNVRVHAGDVVVTTIGLIVFLYVLKYRNVKKFYKVYINRSILYLGQVLCEAGIIYRLAWTEKESRPRFSHGVFFLHVIVFGLLPNFLRLLDSAIFDKEKVSEKYTSLKKNFFMHCYITIFLVLLLEIRSFIPDNVHQKIVGLPLVSNYLSEFWTILKIIIHSFYIFWSVSKADNPYIDRLLAQDETDRETAEKAPRENGAEKDSSKESKKLKRE